MDVCLAFVFIIQDELFLSSQALGDKFVCREKTNVIRYHSVITCIMCIISYVQPCAVVLMISQKREKVAKRYNDVLIADTLNLRQFWD